MAKDMPKDDRFDAYEEGLKVREELKEKALKLAYEIASEVERVTKVKLTFEQFDFIFKRTLQPQKKAFTLQRCWHISLFPKYFGKGSRSPLC